MDLVGYCDASFAMEQDNKSTEGWIFMYRSTPVAWKPGTQSVTATFSTTAEYITLYEAAKEAAFLAQHAFQMGLRKAIPV